MQSKRLLFRHFHREDFADYFSLAGNAAVMKRITQKGLSREEALSRFSKVLKTNSLYTDVGIYAAYLKENMEFLGLGKLEMVNAGEAEVGYSMLPRFWGQGYGTEISQTMVQQALKVRRINRLMAIIDPENLASRRILEKCEFQLERNGEWQGMPAIFYFRNLER